ncbi:MAG: ATP-binding cassette domain-containing protein [Defluviitaleaceae bacterium]|nr:ATP-binding cassette domain-containing protein [Defluviitaleaceae bacterium]
METYKIENLTFSYPTRPHPALLNVNLTIKSGEFITVCGSSGCGKTTLLRHIKPSATPHGVKTGRIFFENTPLEELSPRDGAAKIGFVFQSPENQIVTDKVWHELAFGLESLGMKTPEIRLRVAETASFFGIQSWFHKSVTELSGGQKQILALASIMALQPSVLILDEPTSQLDPIAAGEFLGMIGKINRELGTTVILTEHRLEEVLSLSTRVIVMEKGQMIAHGTPAEIGTILRTKAHSMFLAMPTPMRVWAACDGKDQCPITVREGADWLNTQKIIQTSTAPPPMTTGKRAVTVKDLWFKYEKNLPDVVKGLNFQANYGEITAILGGNGTGKTTTLSLILGLYSPYRGKIHTHEPVYALPQNPQTLFVAKTLREDLQEVLPAKKEAAFTQMIKLCRLENLLDSHPYDLSGGEQQRAALAKVLLLQPKILLLDEPTKGLDAEYKAIFAGILQKLAQDGTAIIMVSHDIEFCAEYATRCALFFDGDIVAENTPKAFFSGNSFYTTGANRMARQVLPEAVTPQDIITALGGKLTTTTKSNPPDDTPAKPYVNNETQYIPPSNPPKPPLPKRTMLAAALILLSIPITIYAGIYFFDDRRFYFISMLIILQTMIPFMMIFESRKPQAREIVVIAVLCALAVAGRSAFFMLPQFKPVIAIVIIAGVAFGGESGFLVGAVTAFVSNMFFGQGPWTPWQMFAFGMIGFLAGILFHKKLLQSSPIPLAIFGGLATLIIYGGIMNPASVLMWQPNPTIEMFLMSYIMGFPFDIIHAVATVFFLLIISRPMLEKLDRIKIKYGLVEEK